MSDDPDRDLHRWRVSHLLRFKPAGAYAATMVAWISCSFSATPAAAQEILTKPLRMPYRNLSPEVDYVGSQACAVCHGKIYQSYKRTPMGRSMSLASAATHLQKVSKPVVIAHKRLGRQYTVFTTGKAIYQSEYELDDEGKEVFRTTHKLEYAVGSGINGYTYVVRRKDHLFEAPLSFYSRIGRWDLSPGYQFDDVGFNRPIVTECIICHSGLPQPARQAEGRFRDPPFRELSIGCENCHGPGQRHVQERGLGKAPSAEVDWTIVNPATLPAPLAEDICMKCHQEADARILQPGKNYLDIRPGIPLSESLALFKVPLKQGARNDTDLLEHHFSLKASRCYLESGGRLSCVTCHNPHESPAATEKADYYRGKCLTCHRDSECSMSHAARARRTVPNGCVGCHMPKREVKVISHSSLTQHRILRKLQQPYPPIAYQQTSSALPDLVYVNGRQPELDSLPCVTLLQAYAEIARKRPEYLPRYLAVLEECRETYFNHPFVRAALGRREMAVGTSDANRRAVAHLLEAIKLGVNAPGPYEDLAEVTTRLGRLEDTIEILQKGVEEFPYVINLRKSLAFRYMASKRYAEAKQVTRESSELFPGDAVLRELMKKLETVFPPP